MRILLTGTSGQVGGALRPVLSAYELLTPDRHVFDLSKPETLAAALDALKPDIVINPAAYTAVDRAEDDAALAFVVNADAPAVMARWAAMHGVPLVHFSTDYVFDGSGDIAWNERDETRPLSVYGRSKCAGEAAVRDANGPHLIIRTSWVYAVKGNNFLRTITRLAHERDTLRIVADQYGAPTSARSIADAVEAIVGRGREAMRADFARSEGVVHVTSSGVTNWHGFATAIVAGLKNRGFELMATQILPIAASEFPTKAIRPVNSRLSHARLNEVFGIEIPDWRSALDVELDALAQIIRQVG